MPRTSFQVALRTWYERHKRALPWRESDDPYQVWLSEVILQQTRVSQGLPYYHKFLRKFPNVRQLAQAPEEEVMKLWEGLGYYSRARNLHAAAKTVAEQMDGHFPRSYQALRQLKGVGDYTAAAISSFIANEPRAVLDGNVFRVLARYYGVDVAINSGAGKKLFAQLAADNLDRDDPATYNQAIMEFGALQCVPRNPNCAECPLQQSCVAYIESRVTDLPQKERKRYDRQRYFYYCLFEHDGKLLVEQRQEKDIWRNLFQLPLLEFSQRPVFEAVLGEVELRFGLSATDFLEAEALLPHKLSHQTIHIHILRFAAGSQPRINSDREKWRDEAELETLAFPRPLRQYLDRNQLTLPFS